jgi:hypothetical protein
MSMNQVVRGVILKGRAQAAPQVSEPTADPVASAAQAIERCLAQAHEAGNQDAVRLLHAVSALLMTSPRIRV